MPVGKASEICYTIYMVNIFIIIGHLMVLPNGVDAYLFIKQRIPHQTMKSCVDMMTAINSGPTDQVAACVQQTPTEKT